MPYEFFDFMFSLHPIIFYLFITIWTGVMVMVRMDHIADEGFYTQLFAATFMGILWPVFWLLYLYVKIRGIKA